MTIKEISAGYFQKTDDEKRVVVETVVRAYVEDMIEQGGTLVSLNAHLMLMKESAIRHEEYEVVEVMQQVIDGIHEVLEEFQKNNPNSFIDLNDEL